MAASADAAPREGTPRPFSRLVLFDGVCVICNRTVRWLMERDPEGRLRFAPLQGETAAELRGRHPEIPGDIDTLVYVDASGGEERVHLRSEALFRLWGEVDPDNRWPRLLSALPRPLTDLAYRTFIRFRYRIFGRYDACPIPTPEERARFLD